MDEKVTSKLESGAPGDISLLPYPLLDCTLVCNVLHSKKGRRTNQPFSFQRCPSSTLLRRSFSIFYRKRYWVSREACMASCIQHSLNCCSCALCWLFTGHLRTSLYLFARGCSHCYWYCPRRHHPFICTGSYWNVIRWYWGCNWRTYSSCWVRGPVRDIRRSPTNSASAQQSLFLSNSAASI